MKRAEVRELRSQTAIAGKRATARTARDLALVEWDGVRARIKRIRDPGRRDQEWRQVAAALAGLGYG